MTNTNSKNKIYVFATLKNINCFELINNYFKSDYDITYILPSACCDNYSRLNENNICKILDENLILSKEEFAEILNEVSISNKCRELLLQRFFWYYQQFLKLVLALTCNQEKFIIWDGDTIPINKINFFSDNKQFIFISPYEYHYDYFKTNNFLYKKNYVKTPYSQIVQFSPLTNQNIDLLKDALKIVSKNHVCIKKILIKNVVQAINETLDSDSISLFSEYEFLGNIKLQSQRKIENVPLLFYRDSITTFSRFKIKLLSLLNFKTVSFENYDSTYKLTFVKFIANIIIFYYRYLCLAVSNRNKRTIKFK